MEDKELFESEWFKSRPRIVQDILRKFPPNHRYNINGRILFVLGATEQGDLIVSKLDPNLHYEEAIEQKEYICSDCIEKLNVKDDKNLEELR